MVDIVKKDIAPACISYQYELAKVLNSKKAWGDKYECGLEEHFMSKISSLSSCLLKKLEILENAVLETKNERDALKLAMVYRDRVLAAMAELRLVVDELETLIPSKYWPLPTYADLLYSVN